MKKKVLIVTSVASMVEQFLTSNIELLISLGYKVDVAANFEKGNTCSEDEIIKLKKYLETLDVNYYQIDFSRNVLNALENYKSYSQLKKIANANDYFFVHCHSPIGGVLGRIVFKKKEAKVIYTAHGFHFFKNAPIKNWLIFFPIEKYLSKFSSMIITINSEDYSIAKKKFLTSEVRLINGVGIDTEKITQKKVNVLSKREELNFSKDDFIMLSIGELNNNKNHETIIEAISEIEYQNCHYLICGKGPLEDSLKQKCEVLNIQNRVHFLGYRSDIVDICKISDVFVFPSFREGLSVSLMEAMCSGLPVICSNIRGNKDLVEKEKGGILLHPSDVVGFREAIKHLYKHPQIRKLYSNHNKNVVRKFDLESVNRSLIEIYNEVK